MVGGLHPQGYEWHWKGDFWQAPHPIRPVAHTSLDDRATA